MSFSGNANQCVSKNMSNDLKRKLQQMCTMGLKLCKIQRHLEVRLQTATTCTCLVSPSSMVAAKKAKNVKGPLWSQCFVCSF